MVEMGVLSEAEPSTSAPISGDEPATIDNRSALEFALSRIEVLEEQLRLCRLESLEKDQKCESLVKLQTKVDNEVEELTGALFQEAYRMVNTAEERSQNAERLLAEARLKVDVLESEVLGLKQIVKDTSRNSARRPPVTPNSGSRSAILRFLNNSLSTKTTDTDNGRASESVKRSLFSNTPLTSMTPKSALPQRSVTNGLRGSESALRPFSMDENEMDPIYYREFTTWRENALGFDENCAFLRRILREDVEPCLVFENKELSNRVLSAIKENRLEMEPYVAPDTDEDEDGLRVSRNFRECALLIVRRQCPYRLRLTPDLDWLFISVLARNRIAAVCDFFTYIRYLNQGITRPSTNDSYWCIINLRKNMALARLGLHFVPKINAASSPPDSLATSPQTGGPISY